MERAEDDTAAAFHLVAGTRRWNDGKWLEVRQQQDTMLVEGWRNVPRRSIMNFLTNALAHGPTPPPLPSPPPSPPPLLHSCPSIGWNSLVSGFTHSLTLNFDSSRHINKMFHFPPPSPSLLLPPFSHHWLPDFSSLIFILCTAETKQVLRRRNINEQRRKEV